MKIKDLNSLDMKHQLGYETPVIKNKRNKIRQSLTLPRVVPPKNEQKGANNEVHSYE